MHALTAQVAKPAVTPNLGKLPLSFTANQGQADKGVNFLANGQGYGLYLTPNQAVLALHKPASSASRANMRQIARLRARWPFLTTVQRQKLAKMSASLPATDTLRMELKGSNAQAQVSGSDELAGTTNYFIGNHPTQWRTRVPSFAKVHYTGVYPGIDLIYYGNQGRLEYDFEVAPHADPGQVALHFSGARQLDLDRNGNLLVFAENGQVAFAKPVVYQDVKGRRVPVKGQYALLANHTVGFKVGKYDRSKSLVIDPTLSYATYLGGSTDDAATAIAVDTTGIYIIGFTADTDFPVTTGAFQTTNAAGHEVSFVTKLNLAGSALIYSTYLGGTDNDTQSSGNDSFGIAVDTAGSAYICGETFDNDFPVTTGAYQTKNNGFANDASNVFVSKLSADGTALAYSTYLGGSGLNIDDDFFEGDSPLRMTVDGGGNAYVVGTAYSTDFPTTAGAYQLVNKAAANLTSNAFVTKLNPSGTLLAYSTYLGGSGISRSIAGTGVDEGLGEAGYGIAVDANGEAYVTGFTFSSDFPSAGGYQQVNHGTANVAANAFVSKLNAGGTGLVASTYLGGSGLTIGGGNTDLDASDNGDDGIGVALDTANNAYVVGVSSSIDFPTTGGAIQTTNKAAANSAANVFVSKLDSTLSKLIYSTYLGGSGIANADNTGIGSGDFATGVAVDTAGEVFITGATESLDFPVTANAFQATPRSSQTIDSGFFSQINPNGTLLDYSTYVGGSGASAYGGTTGEFFDGDFFYDIALDTTGGVYLTGYAFSYDFPVTKDALQRVNNAGGLPGGNGVIAKFAETPGVTYLPTTTTVSSTMTGASFTFTAVVKTVTGTGVPSGTSTFYLNGVKQTTVTLDQTGTATFTTDQLATESPNDVIAAYSGDATYGASGSSLGQTPATPGNTATLLVFSTPPTAAIGQGSNGGVATVTVQDASGDIVATPAVTVTLTLVGPAGFTPLTFTTTTVNGVGTFNFGNTPLTVPGTYSYIAASAGLVSAFAFETVAPVITSIAPNALAVGSPATAIVLTGNFIGFGDSNDLVCFEGPSGVYPAGFNVSNATVQATIPAAAMTLAGSVQVSIGNGDCTQNVSNVAVLNVSNVQPSTSGVLTITPSPVAYGKAVTLSATITLNSLTAPIPVTSGQVVFCSIPASICNGQFNIGSAQLNGVGVASLSVYPGAVGVHTYEALFLGTPSAAQTFAPEQTVTVTGTFPTASTLSFTGTPGDYTLTSSVIGQGTLGLTPSGSIAIIDQTNSNTAVGTIPLVTGVAAQTLVAATGSPVTTGAEPYAVASGDFNGDGFQDFAVANYAAGNVSVFLGNGDGTFQPQVTYGVGASPEGIATADMNGDGILDLVVANTGSSTVTVLYGKGDGTFPGGAGYPASNGAAGIAIADFNHDGRPDIAVSDYYGGTVGILLASADGFVQVVTYTVGSTPRTVVAGDFNGDGNIDLAVANQNDNTLSILYGNGDGTFQAQIVYPLGTAPQGLAVADFNNDGIPDLAIGNFGTGGETGNLGIMLGLAGGGFGNMTVYGAGGGPIDPVVADFNGDGFPDVAIENFNDGSESVLLGNGDGTFQTQSTFLTGTSPYAAAVGDFNGDGNPDLVISNFGSNNETILLDQITSTVTGVLTPVALTGIAGNHTVVAIYPGDTNFTTSTSPAITLVVSAGGPVATTLTLSANPTSSTVGQSVTLTANLAPFNGNGVSTDGETVTFSSNNAAIGTGTLTNGVATFATTALPLGADTLAASYAGDTNFLTSTSAPYSYAVSPAGATTTTTTLQVTAGGKVVTTVAANTTVSLIASVVTAAGTPATPGTVTFCDATATYCQGSGLLGSAQLSAAGTATLSFVPGIGTHSYKAIFGATTGFTTSTSTAQPLAVTGATYPTTTTIAAAGTPGNYTLTGTVVGAASSYAEKSVFVVPSQAWTDTGLTVTAGQPLVLSATGEMNWNSDSCGIACTNGPGGSNPPLIPCPYGVVAPNSNCYSLIGMIGSNGAPFEVGASLNMVSPATGELFLGVNDGNFGDNTIGWTAFVNLSPAPTGSVNFVDTTNANTSLGTAPLGTPVLGLSFINSATPAALGNPTAIVTGDWNGDGIPDLAIGNLESTTLTILLGKGDGTYTAVTGPTVNSKSYELTVGDFNGDGKADLAVVDASQSEATILLSNGDGTFTNGGGLELSDSPGGVVAADFNADGNLDLAVSNATQNSVSIYLGDGKGNFNNQSSNASAQQNPGAMAVGDWNGDGIADLAVTNAIGNSITVYLSNGDGTLTTVGNVATGNDPQAIAAGDFNGDGKLDLAVANHNDATVTILLGDGTGNFTAVASAPATGGQPFGIAVADYNGDGILDLATANYSGASVSVLLGVGDGTFNAAPNVTVGSAPQAIVAGDWNGDGAPDFATANAGGNTASVMLTQRTQTVTATLSNVSVTGAAGNHNVVATYPGDTTYAASTSTPVVLTPVAISTPAIASLNPNSAYVGSGDTIVTITGTDFITGAAVSVNGTSQAATFVSATQLTTTLTAAQLSAVGTLNLAVVNTDGGTSNPSAFTVLQLPLQLAPANLAFGNQTVGTSSEPQVVTVTNSTDGTINITSISLTLGINPADFAQTNNCPAALEAGDTCQITVTFTPGGVGAKSAGMQISDSTTGLPTEAVNMTGTGTGGILQVNPGNLKTIAGTGTAGYSGDGGAAVAAELNTPDGVNFDAQGNMYIADVANNVIRKVDTAGNITTVAGNGTAGFSGDGGKATAAQLNGPFGVVPDAAGNLYIEDSLNARIRKVDTAGNITTIAGNGTFGLSGDGGPATAAEVAEVQGGRFDAAGNFYVAQCGPAAIRKITPAGIITTVAGTGTDGFSGDGGPATSAQLNCASGVAIDAAGELFIADYLNFRVRKVNIAGVISTIAGTGTPGFSGDGGPAVAAQINLPNDVDVDAAGNVYIADSGNNRLRLISPTGVISTLVGGLNNAGSAGVNAPSGIAFDTAGNSYFSDSGNNAIREVFPAGALVFPATEIGTAAANETVTLSNIGNVPVAIAGQGSFALSGNSTDFSLAGGSCLAGATLAANGGTCSLQLGFTPTALGTRTLNVSITDDAVYSPQSFSISGTGVNAPAVVLSSISPTGALAGATDTMVTATGANFTATSVLNFNAAPLVTTFVSATQLSAVVPAALIVASGTANITVTDPSSESTSQPAVFTILPGTPQIVTFTAPAANPGEQPTLNFSLTQAYPVAIAGTMTLTFTPDTGNPDNPQVQLASTSADVTVGPGGRTLTFPLAANSTATPVVMVQVGNVSGTITVTLQLTAAGVNVTPTNVVPATIVVARVAPTISALSFTASGNTLTVLVTGFSTTREIGSATFNFTAASGATLNQKSLTVPATGLFTTWYTNATSAQYGSAFTYSQVFTLTGNASAVAGVGATLTNSIGTSTEVTAP